VSFTYHCYHDDGFGIYKNTGLPEDSGVFAELRNDLMLGW